MLFPSRSVSWLIVFLGNPGIRYTGTRHNAGFMAADAFARKKNLSIDRARFRALTAVCSIGDQKVLLMKPQTYMNLSGEAVGQAARFYKIPPEHILVLSDDVTLPVGSLRIRTKGSAGGHNGLKNIIAVLGTDAFPRIRIGVGSPPDPDYEMIDWVLSVFRNQDAVDMADAVEYAQEALESGKERGFIDDYRWRKADTGDGALLLFLDCGRNLDTFRSFLLTSLAVSALGLLAVFLLILAFSGRVVRPVAESYEKQKRFITDAGHEIKTPLAIIEADADVLEMELEGESEWLSDIRLQTRRLTDLTNDLVYLSRMEERADAAPFVDFPLSDIVDETAQSFAPCKSARPSPARLSVI